MRSIFLKVLPSLWRHNYCLSLSKLSVLLLCLAAPAWLYADTISGTVLDPSGAVIVGARVEITGGDLS